MMQSGRDTLIDVIKPMRFPLIVLVLYVHSLGFSTEPVSLCLDGWNIYHFISEMISHNLGTIAVCWFYVFSGYLFFYGNEDINWAIVKNKWKRRCQSLLAPYLIWNAIFVIGGFLRNGLFSGCLGVDASVPQWGQFDFIYWFITGPADYPLYFVRDLIIMSLVAPIWFCLTKLSKWGSIALILAFYLSPFGLGIPGKNAITFFCMGAWLSIWKVDVLRVCSRNKIACYILALVTLVICPFLNQTQCYGYILRFSILVWMIAFLNAFLVVIRKNNLSSTLSGLSGSVFFIYAFHEFFILGWTKGLMVKLLGTGLVATCINYIFVPIIVLCVCLCLYALLSKYAPRTMAVVCGGRTSKR